ncbi:MAG: MltA domain-containing protein [Alphaproteobacteria bacterium]|nr:MltA domain-containing protein [Alphaproteobacteria bacterium]
MIIMRAALGFAAAVAVTLGACAPVSKTPDIGSDAGAPETPPRIQLHTRAFSVLPGWAEDRHGEALAAFRGTCASILKRPDDSALAANGSIPSGRVADWRAPCEAAGKIDFADHGAARAFFETWFQPFEVRAVDPADDRPEEGLFTGYFEPELRGAWTRGGKYQTPLYARPDDLVSVNLGSFADDLGGATIWGRVDGGRLTPYATRADIETRGPGGALKPLLWVDDAVDAFFLHVQGSGRIRMENGSVVRVGFAGKNGRPYKSIGRILIERGEIKTEGVSLDAIRDWVRARPDAGRALLRENPSFVFFRVVDGVKENEGPVGAAGVPLTPGRSLAVDRRYLPLGAPMWLDTSDPLAFDRPIRRLMVAQDTGGAIKGAVRGDIFFGSGKDAEARAGNMKHPGRYYLLLPLSVTPPQAAR